MARWQSANIVQSTSGGRQLWQFSANGERFTFNQNKVLSLSEPLPAGAVAKDWQTLFRKKLNVAWLPADKVFLRVVHLPTSDVAEIQSMVELQLEKLSPLPVTQIVWSLYPLPKDPAKPDALQSVVVIISLRDFVEGFLGELEVSGYLADRLEVSSLDQLLVTKITDDGVWIYPGENGEPVLVAWWYAGVLQNIAMLAMPPGPERGPLLKSQMEQIAWAGELDGWLTAPPKVHLVATSAEAAFWQPILHAWAEAPIETTAPLTPTELASLNAQRVAAEGSRTNLLPAEFATRYKQIFVDGLWLRGLLTALVIYVFGVVAYFVAVGVMKYNYAKLDAYVKQLAPDYNAAVMNETQIQILKDRQELKYAALDCWKVVAENLPTTITLESLSFQHGRLEMRGTVSSDQQLDVTVFNEAMRKALTKPTDGSAPQLMFEEVSPPAINSRPPLSDWHFGATMKGADNQ